MPDYQPEKVMAVLAKHRVQCIYIGGAAAIWEILRYASIRVDVPHATTMSCLS